MYIFDFEYLLDIELTLWLICDFDDSMKKKRNSIANALELRLSCTNLSIWK